MRFKVYVCFCLLVFLGTGYVFWSLTSPRTDSLKPKIHSVFNDVSSKLFDYQLQLYNRLGRSLSNRIFVSELSETFIHYELKTYNAYSKRLPRVHRATQPIKLEVDKQIPPSHPQMHPNNSTSISLINFMIDVNSKQFVFNQELLTHMKYVMVIQVHNRLEYLRILIHSLLHAHNIHKVLLIFSHDYYSPKINALIQMIKFAPVMQIYMPFNTQLFKDTFPAKHLDHPTSNIKYTQLKHHWAFKVAFVFQNINILKNYTERIIFLEDDYYVVEDILYIYELMHKIENRRSSNYDIFSFGTYAKHIWRRKFFFYESKFTTMHNLGLTFNREFWEKIYKHRQEFCRFDDYNWDWTLAYTVKPTKMLTVGAKKRLIHIGKCGIHSKDCTGIKTYNLVHNTLMQLLPYLFSDTVDTDVENYKYYRSHKGWGGWSDKRDQKLCMELFYQNDDLYKFFMSNSYDPLEKFEDFLMKM